MGDLDDQWVQWHQWQLKELERQSKKLDELERGFNKMCINCARTQAELKAQIKSEMSIKQHLLSIGSAVGTFMATMLYLWLRGVI